MIREATEKLIGGSSLSMEEASGVMTQIMEGEATPVQLASFLTALRIKGETPGEIAGMASVMRDKALPVETDGVVVDTCGTGGARAKTFNISTATAFVAAGAGLKVAKHGNRAASGTCGSADVLEALGVELELPPKAVQRCINEVGMGFMFALVFHPAMRYAAPVRRDMGIRTVFNVLGPLTSPARVKQQLLGVAEPALGEKMAQVLNLMGSEHCLVVHSSEGADELTLGGENHVWELKAGEVSHSLVNPQDLGLAKAPWQAIRGGTPADNAFLLRRILTGERGAHRDVVLLNSAAVLMVGGLVESLQGGVEMAAQVIDDGRALTKLEALVEVSQELAMEAEGQRR